jgi:hypothetical protein
VGIRCPDAANWGLRTSSRFMQGLASVAKILHHSRGVNPKYRLGGLLRAEHRHKLRTIADLARLNWSTSAEGAFLHRFWSQICKVICFPWRPRANRARFHGSPLSPGTIRPRLDSNVSKQRCPAGRPRLTTAAYPTGRCPIAGNPIAQSTLSSTPAPVPRTRDRIVQGVIYRGLETPEARIKGKAERARSSGTRALRCAMV